MGIRLPKFRWFQTRPKTAWCCRWVLGSVAVLALAAWVFTIFGTVYWWKPKVMTLGLADGRVNFMKDAVAADGTSLYESIGWYTPGVYANMWFTSWTIADSWYEIVTTYVGLPQMWWDSRATRFPPILIVQVPLWVPFMLSAPPALAAWRNRWVVKRDVGTCHHCGYSRTGLAGGVAAVCPECGEAPRA